MSRLILVSLKTLMERFSLKSCLGVAFYKKRRRQNALGFMETGCPEQEYFRALGQSEEVVVRIDSDSRIVEETYVRRNDQWLNRGVLVRPKLEEDREPSTLLEGWDDVEAQLLANHVPDTITGVFQNSSFFTQDQMVLILTTLKSSSIQFFNNATGDDLDRLTERLLRENRESLPQVVMSRGELIEQLKSFNTLVVTDLTRSCINLSVWCKDIESWVFVKTYVCVFDESKT